MKVIYIAPKSRKRIRAHKNIRAYFHYHCTLRCMASNSH